MEREIERVHIPSVADIYFLRLDVHRLAYNQFSYNEYPRRIFPSPHSIKANFLLEGCLLSFSFSNLNASISSSTFYS